MPPGRAGVPSQLAEGDHGRSPSCGALMHPERLQSASAAHTASNPERTLEIDHIVFLQGGLLPVDQHIGHNKALIADDLTEADAGHKIARRGL